MYLIKDKMYLIFDTENQNIYLKLELENLENEKIILSFLRVEVNYIDDEYDNLNTFLSEEYEIENEIVEEDFISEFEGIQYQEEKNISFVSEINLNQEIIEKYIIDKDLKEDFENFLVEINKSFVSERKDKKKND